MLARYNHLSLKNKDARVIADIRDVYKTIIPAGTVDGITPTPAKRQDSHSAS